MHTALWISAGLLAAVALAGGKSSACCTCVPCGAGDRGPDRRGARRHTVLDGVRRRARRGWTYADPRVGEEGFDPGQHGRAPP